MPQIKFLASFEQIIGDTEQMAEQANIMTACSNSGLRPVILIEVFWFFFNVAHELPR
jgi:hypothetical protein